MCFWQNEGKFCVKGRSAMACVGTHRGHRVRHHLGVSPRVLRLGRTVRVHPANACAHARKYG
jgi:hypothetical protein